ncbi:hypothetical protein CBM2629_A150339 [Cupriavidus taiwanensis]|nr:hypothetical protein CBM2629_A150339 [Cupriavidus taiwanensis]
MFPRERLQPDRGKVQAAVQSGREAQAQGVARQVFRNLYPWALPQDSGLTGLDKSQGGIRKVGESAPPGAIGIIVSLFPLEGGGCITMQLSVGKAIAKEFGLE